MPQAQECCNKGHPEVEIRRRMRRRMGGRIGGGGGAGGAGKVEVEGENKEEKQVGQR